MRPFFENNVLQQQPFKPMIIVVDTTKAGSASNTFVLPIIKDTTETVKIYWGDGTNSIGVNGDNTHVYAASGVYTVKIESNLFGGIYFNNVGDKSKITKINTLGGGVVRSVTSSFYGCNSLASASLTAVLVSKNPIFMFYNCTSLTSVSLFSLTAATNTTSCFFGCTSLTTIPLLDLSRVTIATNMFLGCTSLTTIPLLDLSKCTATQNMFRNCTSLTTIPLLDLSSVTTAIDMFLGCTLTTTSYSDFLINLATLPLQNGVSFHGGNSKYNVAGGVARAYIISTFGWTITDGGAA